MQSKIMHCLVSLGSFSQNSSSIFVFHDINFLKSIRPALHRLPLILGLSDVSSQLDPGGALVTGIPQGSSWVLLSSSHQDTRNNAVSSPSVLCDVNFDHSVQGRSV